MFFPCLRSSYYKSTQTCVHRCFRCVGDAGRRPTEIPTPRLTLAYRSWQTFAFDDDCNTRSHLLQDQVAHTGEPWRGSGGLPAKGRSRRRSALCWRPQDGDGLRQKSSVHRRSWCSMTWHGGHVSNPHSWDTEIFVNLKGL
jgi:hypothetical protein